MRRSIYIVIDQKDGDITNPCRLVESEWEEVPQAVKVSATALHPRNFGPVRAGVFCCWTDSNKAAFASDPRGGGAIVDGGGALAIVDGGGGVRSRLLTGGRSRLLTGGIHYHNAAGS